MSSNECEIFFFGNYLSAGTHQASRSVAEGLEETGVKVWIAKPPGNMIFRLGYFCWVALSCKTKIAHVDIFSGKALIWSYLVTWILEKRGIPIICSLHGGNLPHVKGFYKRLFFSITAKAKAVTAPSKFIPSALNLNHVFIIQNPIDLSAYHHLNHVPEHLTILWMRAFQEIYDPIAAIQIFSRVHEQVPEARMLMAGPDKGDGTLKKCFDFIQSCGLEDKVEIMGLLTKKDVPHFLNRGSVFLNTSKVDNTPLTLLEALAAGLPLVTTRKGGIPELVEPASFACTNDTEELASAIVKLLKNPKERTKFSELGKRHVEQCDWSYSKQKWLDIILPLLESRS